MADTDVDRYTEWITSFDDSDPPATDRIRLNITIELLVARPDWFAPDDALGAVLSSLADADLPYRILESWGYGEPPLAMIDQSYVGADGRIEAV